MILPPHRERHLSLVNIAIWLGGGAIITAAIIIFLYNKNIQDRVYYLLWLSTVASIQGFAINRWKNIDKYVKSVNLSTRLSIYMTVISAIFISVAMISKSPISIIAWIFEFIFFSAACYYLMDSQINTE